MDPKEKMSKKQDSESSGWVKFKMREDGGYDIVEVDPNIITSARGQESFPLPRVAVSDAVTLLNGVFSRLPDNASRQALEVMKFAGLALLAMIDGYANERQLKAVAKMHDAIDPMSEPDKREEVVQAILKRAEEPWCRFINRGEQLLVEVYAIKSGVYLQAHEIAEELPPGELEMARAVIERAESKRKGGRGHKFVESAEVKAFLEHFGFKTPSKGALQQARRRRRVKK